MSPPPNLINEISPPPDEQTTSVIFRMADLPSKRAHQETSVSSGDLHRCSPVHPSVAACLLQPALPLSLPAFIINSCDAAQSSLAEWYTSIITNKPKYLHSAGAICIREQGAWKGEPDPPVRQRRCPALSGLVLIFRWTFTLMRECFHSDSPRVAENIYSPECHSGSWSSFFFFFCSQSHQWAGELVEAKKKKKLRFSRSSATSVSGPLVHMFLIDLGISSGFSIFP